MKWPHEEVQEMGKQQEEGLYKVKVISQEDTHTNDGIAMIISHGRIVAPDRLRLQSFDLVFRLGVTESIAEALRISTGEDLDAENPETWKGNPSAKRYKSYLKALRVASVGDSEEEAEDVKGKTYYVMMQANKKGYVEPKSFYSEDEPPRGAEEEQLAKPAKEESEENGLRRKPAKPASTKAAPVRSPKVAAKPQPEEAEEEDEWE